MGEPTVELLRDADRPDAWMLLVDGVPQSHVDLGDPTYLAFEYVRRLGHVIDTAAEPGMRVDAVHLGGGALTLARYVASTRPRSRQRVMELNGALTELVRRELPLARAWAIRVREIDARDGLAALPDASADLVIADVFAGARLPAHLATLEYVRDAARVLRDTGCYAANVGDGPPLRFARAQAATVTAVFPHVAVLAEPGVLRGRRYGNLVLVAARRPLAEAELRRRCAGDPVPARVLAGGQLRDWVGGTRPVRDGDEVVSPEPPPDVFASRPR